MGVQCGPASHLTHNTHTPQGSEAVWGSLCSMLWGFVLGVTHKKTPTEKGSRDCQGSHPTWEGAGLPPSWTAKPLTELLLRETSGNGEPQGPEDGLDQTPRNGPAG